MFRGGNPTYALVSQTLLCKQKFEREMRLDAMEET